MWERRFWLCVFTDRSAYLIRPPGAISFVARRKILKKGVQRGLRPPLIPWGSCGTVSRTYFVRTFFPQGDFLRARNSAFDAIKSAAVPRSKYPWGAMDWMILIAVAGLLTYEFNSSKKGHLFYRSDFTTRSATSRLHCAHGATSCLSPAGSSFTYMRKEQLWTSNSSKISSRTWRRTH